MNREEGREGGGNGMELCLLWRWARFWGVGETTDEMGDKSDSDT